MSRSCTLVTTVALLAACGLLAGCTAGVGRGPSPTHEGSVTASPTRSPDGATAPPPSPGDASGEGYLAYSGAASHAGSSASASSLSGSATFASVGCAVDGQELQRLDAPQPPVESSPTLTVLRKRSALSLTFTAEGTGSGPVYKAASAADGHIAGLTLTQHSGRWDVSLVHVKVSDPDATTGVENVTLEGNLRCPAP